MNYETTLAKLGLSKNEIKTYIALLRLGSVPAGPLIKDLGMHRAAVYNLLDILIDKGLVHYVIQANRKYFEAQEPERLKELIESKRKDLDTYEQELNEYIPQLHAIRELSTESQEGTIYKGKKGLKSIFEDILSHPNQELCVMGATGKFKEILHAYFIHWHKRRTAQKIKLRIIYTEAVRKKKREKELMHAEVKYTSNNQFTPATTLVYSDKVIIIAWSEITLTFSIRSKMVSASYMHYFNELWKTAKK
ncbi:MAG: TrmB family transcriptional regulator [Candidatus Woesearchaeota archaeon]